MFVFFFSSRRRHTRSDRDWSSDVCSSDLTRFRLNETAGENGLDFRSEEQLIAMTCPVERLHAQPITYEEQPAAFRVPEGEREHRSEERRVGKECRCVWAPYQ